MLTDMLAEAGADNVTLAVARGSDSAGALLAAAGEWRGALADSVARRGREVVLATLSGVTAVEVAIVDRGGEFLARVGAEGQR